MLFYRISFLKKKNVEQLYINESPTPSFVRKRDLHNLPNERGFAHRTLMDGVFDPRDIFGERDRER